MQQSVFALSTAATRQRWEEEKKKKSPPDLKYWICCLFLVTCCSHLHLHSDCCNLAQISVQMISCSHRTRTQHLGAETWLYFEAWLVNFWLYFTTYHTLHSTFSQDIQASSSWRTNSSAGRISSELGLRETFYLNKKCGSTSRLEFPWLINWHVTSCSLLLSSSIIILRINIHLFVVCSSVVSAQNKLLVVLFYQILFLPLSPKDLTPSRSVL